MNRYWMYVLFAGILEIVWVTALKYSGTILHWTGTFTAIIISFIAIIIATKSLPVGTVYAVFAGMGTGGTVLVEMFMYGEPREWSRLVCIAMILSSTVGLKLIS